MAEYAFITLDDGTQLSHSEMLADHHVRVYLKCISRKGFAQHVNAHFDRGERPILSRNNIWWLVMVLVSGTGLAGAMIYNRKRAYGYFL